MEGKNANYKDKVESLKHILGKRTFNYAKILLSKAKKEQKG
jgi:hypothetical protein